MMFFDPTQIKDKLILDPVHVRRLEKACWLYAKSRNVTASALKRGAATAFIPEVMPIPIVVLQGVHQNDIADYIHERNKVLQHEITARRHKDDRLRAHAKGIGRHMITALLYDQQTTNAAAFEAFTTNMQKEYVLRYLIDKERGKQTPSLEVIVGPASTTILNIIKHYTRHKLTGLTSQKPFPMLLASLTPEQLYMLERHIAVRDNMQQHIPAPFADMQIIEHDRMVAINAYVREKLKSLKRRRL